MSDNNRLSGNGQQDNTYEPKTLMHKKMCGTFIIFCCFDGIVNGIEKRRRIFHLKYCSALQFILHFQNNYICINSRSLI
ncbi:tRNA-splicing endonuclease subunit [Dirofilaria immitis]